MQLALVQSNKHVQTLEITGGLTGEDSVFPAVEAWLAEDCDHWNAFEKIRGRKNAHRYRSLMDFLLCEVCPSHRSGCFAFYRGKGPQLIFLCTRREIRFLESKLLLFLTIAYEAYAQERALTWTQAASFVEEACTIH